MFLGAPCLPLSIGKSLAGGGRFPASPLAPALALLFPERTGHGLGKLRQQQ